MDYPLKLIDCQLIVPNRYHNIVAKNDCIRGKFIYFWHGRLADGCLKSNNVVDVFIVFGDGKHPYLFKHDSLIRFYKFLDEKKLIEKIDYGLRNFSQYFSECWQQLVDNFNQQVVMAENEKNFQNSDTKKFDVKKYEEVVKRCILAINQIKQYTGYELVSIKMLDQSLQSLKNNNKMNNVDINSHAKNSNINKKICNNVGKQMDIIQTNFYKKKENNQRYKVNRDLYHRLKKDVDGMRSKKIDLKILLVYISRISSLDKLSYNLAFDLAYDSLKIIYNNMDHFMTSACIKQYGKDVVTLLALFKKYGFSVPAMPFSFILANLSSVEDVKKLISQYGDLFAKIKTDPVYSRNIISNDASYMRTFSISQDIFVFVPSLCFYVLYHQSIRKPILELLIKSGMPINAIALQIQITGRCFFVDFLTENYKRKPTSSFSLLNSVWSKKRNIVLI